MFSHSITLIKIEILFTNTSLISAIKPKRSSVFVRIAILSACATVSTAAAAPKTMTGGLYKITSVVQEANRKPVKDTAKQCIPDGTTTRTYVTDLLRSFENATCVTQTESFDEAQGIFQIVRHCTDSDGVAIVSLSGGWTEKSFAASLTVKGQLEKTSAFSAQFAAARKRECMAKDLPSMVAQVSPSVR
jgi:hypothetical protein